MQVPNAVRQALEQGAALAQLEQIGGSTFQDKFSLGAEPRRLTCD